MNTKSQSPKTKQFSEELTALLAKYQYRLLPKLQVTEDGMLPTITIVDVLPPKGIVPAETVEPGEGTSGAIAVKKFSEKEIKEIDEKVKKMKNK